jgi:hypothetical protein
MNDEHATFATESPVHCFDMAKYISFSIFGSRTCIARHIHLIRPSSGRTDSTGDQPDGFRHGITAYIALPENTLVLGSAASVRRVSGEKRGLSDQAA